MKTELEIAKARIAELEAIVKKLSSYSSGAQNMYSASKQMDDYEFNLLKPWKDEPSREENEGSAIKHFGDY